MRRRSNRALLATVIAVTVLVAGCTGQDVQTAVNSSIESGSANLTATVGQCQTERGITNCRIETTNRLGDPAEARLTLAIRRNGTLVDRERTTTQVAAGRSYVSMTFPGSDRGEEATYEVAIERAR